MFTTQLLLEGSKSFFGQLDWKSPYSYIGILGAIGAPSTIFHAVRWIGRFWHTTLLRIRFPSIHKDFYYKSRDFGYRVMEDGSTYLSVRRETIVSMVKSLAAVPLTYRWTGNGEIIEKLSPSNLTLSDLPKILGKTGVRKSLGFERALGKREKLTYTVVLTCKATNHQPEHFLGSGSSRRVDSLILRVAFPIDRHPAHVTYRLLDSDGVEKSRTALECSDQLTGEYRKEIKYPRPFFEHRIEWE